MATGCTDMTQVAAFILEKVSVSWSYLPWSGLPVVLAWRC